RLQARGITHVNSPSHFSRQHRFCLIKSAISGHFYCFSHKSQNKSHEVICQCNHQAQYVIYTAQYVIYTAQYVIYK
ncbi:hypothetical protein, partial [Paenochrobactrum glaciei]|uniref:hypothetical protein n=1 Tax=Paenochrobactrum glaciei TaxID=486407 RepID=UPI0031E09667